MKKAILIGITLGALLALATPAYADGPPPFTQAEVCPILPVSGEAWDHNQAGFETTGGGEYYLCPEVFVTVPLHATNLNGLGILNDYHASPPWRQEGYTPIWAVVEEGEGLE